MHTLSTLNFDYQFFEPDKLKKQRKPGKLSPGKMAWRSVNTQKTGLAQGGRPHGWTNPGPVPRPAALRTDCSTKECQQALDACLSDLRKRRPPQDSPVLPGPHGVLLPGKQRNRMYSPGNCTAVTSTPRIGEMGPPSALPDSVIGWTSVNLSHDCLLFKVPVYPFINTGLGDSLRSSRDSRMLCRNFFHLQEFQV